MFMGVIIKILKSCFAIENRKTKKWQVDKNTHKEKSAGKLFMIFISSAILRKTEIVKISGAQPNALFILSVKRSG